MPLFLPARRLVWVAAALTATAVGVAIAGAFDAQWLTLAAAAALVAALDLLSGLRQPAPAVARHLPATLALGVRVDVALRVANPSARRLRCELHLEQADDRGAEKQLDSAHDGTSATPPRPADLRVGVYSLLNDPGTDAWQPPVIACAEPSSSRSD